MSHSRKIHDLKSLREEKVERKAEVIASEAKIKMNLSTLKEQLFSLEGNEFSLADLGNFSSPAYLMVSKGISNLLIKKWIKPKSKIAKKAATFFSSILIQRLIQGVGKKVIQKVAESNTDRLNK